MLTSCGDSAWSVGPVEGAKSPCPPGNPDHDGRFGQDRLAVHGQDFDHLLLNSRLSWSASASTVTMALRDHTVGVLIRVTRRPDGWPPHPSASTERRNPVPDGSQRWVGARTRCPPPRRRIGPESTPYPPPRMLDRCRAHGLGTSRTSSTTVRCATYGGSSRAVLGRLHRQPQSMPASGAGSKRMPWRNGLEDAFQEASAIRHSPGAWE
jgi:hypothetical protein